MSECPHGDTLCARCASALAAARREGARGMREADVAFVLAAAGKCGDPATHRMLEQLASLLNSLPLPGDGAADACPACASGQHGDPAGACGCACHGRKP